MCVYAGACMRAFCVCVCVYNYASTNTQRATYILFHYFKLSVI